jgi:hypothetical protein
MRWAGHGGGPRGGYRQRYPRIGERWSRDWLIDKLTLICERLNAADTRITGADFAALIEDTSRRAVMFLDPPYFESGSNYRYGFGQADHRRLAALLRQTPHPWVLTYHDCPEVRRLYAWATIGGVYAETLVFHQPGVSERLPQWFEPREQVEVMGIDSSEVVAGKGKPGGPSVIGTPMTAARRQARSRQLRRGSTPAVGTLLPMPRLISPAPAHLVSENPEPVAAPPAAKSPAEFFEIVKGIRAKMVAAERAQPPGKRERRKTGMRAEMKSTPRRSQAASPDRTPSQKIMDRMIAEDFDRWENIQAGFGHD